MVVCCGVVVGGWMCSTYANNIKLVHRKVEVKEEEEEVAVGAVPAEGLKKWGFIN